MDTEQANSAVLSEEAAPVAGAGNEKELAKARLLDEMSGEAATEAGELPEAQAAAPVTGEAEGESEETPKAKNFRGRWDHLNEQDRRVVELTTKRGLTLVEAMRAVYGSSEMPQPEKPVLGQLDVQIEQVQARVEELRQKKAASKGDLEAYDQAAEAYLAAREELQQLRLQRQQAEAAEQARKEKERAEAEARARQRIAEEFPEALVPGTELNEAVAEEMSYLRAAKSPLLDDPQVEYKVARRLARVLGWRAPEVPMKRTVRPVPVGGATVDTPVLALERKMASARTSGAMLELMREIGTPIEALLRKG